MNDIRHRDGYYSIIAKAVRALDRNSGDARRRLYERARAALLAKMRSAENALDEADILVAQASLEREGIGDWPCDRCPFPIEFRRQQCSKIALQSLRKRMRCVVRVDPSPDNFEMIFKGKLQIYEDADEADGQQYATDIGPIDILALERDSGSFVVIELKKGRPSDQVVGQILRYMGWVKRKLCKDGQAWSAAILTQSSLMR
jgi:hypothetical protein